MKGIFMLIMKMMVLQASADFYEKSADMVKITICTSNERYFHADNENDGFVSISWLLWKISWHGQNYNMHLKWKVFSCWWWKWWFCQHQLTFMENQLTWSKLQYAPQMKGLFMLMMKMMVWHATADFYKNQLTWSKLQYAPQMKGFFTLSMNLIFLHMSADCFWKSADMAKITICINVLYLYAFRFIQCKCAF